MSNFRIQRRFSQWEQKKQEKVGEKLAEKNGECVLKSDTERTNRPSNASCSPLANDCESFAKVVQKTLAPKKDWQ